jgi:hypothetical protein
MLSWIRRVSMCRAHCPQAAHLAETQGRSCALAGDMERRRGVRWTKRFRAPLYWVACSAAGVSGATVFAAVAVCAGLTSATITPAMIIAATNLNE